jgi:hypothetical protein
MLPLTGQLATALRNHLRALLIAAALFLHGIERVHGADRLVPDPGTAAFDASLVFAGGRVTIAALIPAGVALAWLCWSGLRANLRSKILTNSVNIDLFSFVCIRVCAGAWIVLLKQHTEISGARKGYRAEVCLGFATHVFACVALEHRLRTGFACSGLLLDILPRSGVVGVRTVVRALFVVPNNRPIVTCRGPFFRVDLLRNDRQV